MEWNNISLACNLVTLNVKGIRDKTKRESIGLYETFIDV